MITSAEFVIDSDPLTPMAELLLRIAPPGVHPHYGGQHNSLKQLDAQGDNPGAPG
jgi:hypothetical protein